MSRADLYANLPEVQKARDGASASTSKTAADAIHDAVQKQLTSRLRDQLRPDQASPQVQTVATKEPAPATPPRKSTGVIGSCKEHIPSLRTSSAGKLISNPGKEAPELPSSNDQRFANQKIHLNSTKSAPNPFPPVQPQKSYPETKQTIAQTPICQAVAEAPSSTSAVVNRNADLSTEEAALPSQPRTSDGNTHNIHKPVDGSGLQRPVGDMKLNRTVEKSPEKQMLRSMVSEPPAIQIDAGHNKPTTKTSGVSANKPVSGIKPLPSSKPSSVKPLNNTATQLINGTLPTVEVKQVSQSFNRSHS